MHYLYSVIAVWHETFQVARIGQIGHAPDAGSPQARSVRTLPQHLQSCVAVGQFVFLARYTALLVISCWYSLVAYTWYWYFIWFDISQKRRCYPFSNINIKKTVVRGDRNGATRTADSNINVHTNTYINIGTSTSTSISIIAFVTILSVAVIALFSRTVVRFSWFLLHHCRCFRCYESYLILEIWRARDGRCERLDQPAWWLSATRF